MRTARIAVVGLAVALGLGMLTAAQSAGGAAAGAGSKPNVGSFHNPRANPYFPLTPGTVLVYRGTEDGEHFRERRHADHPGALAGRAHGHRGRGPPR